MKLAIDISWYNRFTSQQWDIIADLVDGVIVRTSFGASTDGMCNEHMICAKVRKIPVIGYHWADPTVEARPQVDIVERKIENYQLPFMFIDCEQYWSDWDAYMRMDLNQAAATKFNPEQLYKFYTEFIMDCGHRDLDFGVYSADWFTSQYSPKLKQFFTTVPYWEARYMRWYNPSVYATLKKRFPIQAHELPLIMEENPIVSPAIGRQFESHLPVLGLPEKLDWNVFTDAAYYSIFGVDNPDVVTALPYQPENIEDKHQEQSDRITQVFDRGNLPRPM